jgi:hypothetical protein
MRPGENGKKMPYTVVVAMDSETVVPVCVIEGHGHTIWPNPLLVLGKTELMALGPDEAVVEFCRNVVNRSGGGLSIV